jgi:hypothetical protein
MDTKNQWAYPKQREKSHLLGKEGKWWFMERIYKRLRGGVTVRMTANESHRNGESGT